MHAKLAIKDCLPKQQLEDTEVRHRSPRFFGGDRPDVAYDLYSMQMWEYL